LSWSAGNVSQCYVTGPNFQQPYTDTGYAFSDPSECGQGSVTTGTYTTPGYYTYYYTYTLPNVGQASVTVKVDSNDPPVNPQNCPAGQICNACLTTGQDGECTSCPNGYAVSQGACVFTDCPTGYVYDSFGQCQLAGACPAGYAENASNRCVFVSCPLGYTENAYGRCVFTQCPSGYADDGSHTCIRSCTPQYLCGTDNNLYREDASCNITTSPVETCGYGCSGGECLPPPAPKIISFALSPILVKSGETTSVSWNVQNVIGCSVSGTNGDGPWTGLTRTESSSPIIGQVIYTLHCGVIPGAQNADGSLATWTDQADTVNIAPTYQEK